LRASATAPLANWFARLSDVAPDGTVTQITGAGLNGAQRESMAAPRDLEPGIVIRCHRDAPDFVGVSKGHRIRVAISNALCRLVLPTPYAMTTSLELGGADGSRIVLPVVPLQGLPHRNSRRRSPPKNETDIKNEGFPWPGEWTGGTRRSPPESDSALEGQRWI